MAATFFITGTGTHVGKTVLTVLLARRLHERGVRVAALKPLCSGGRHDARLVRRAAGADLSLEEVNPWSFRAALAPQLAAQRERRSVGADEVIAHVRRMAIGREVVLVEGAGGLLSPLGRDFDARTLIIALRARPVIVASNRLGVLNEVLLTVEALAGASALSPTIVLMAPRRRSLLTATNPAYLRRRLSPTQVRELPFLNDWPAQPEGGLSAGLRRGLDSILGRFVE
jgi:dethiobiotin synthetase